MVGSWKVRVHAIRPFTIHGDLYYELQVTRHDAPDEPLAVRVPQHACGEIAVADDVELTFLMGQVTAAKKVNSPA